MQSQQAAVILSRGGIWAPEPFEPPYLQAQPGNPYPADATARVDFYGTDGGLLLTIDDCDVTPDAIRPFADPTEFDLDSIPAGANYEVTLETLNGDYKHRYGKVIRLEPTFYAPPRAAATPHAFSDNFQRTALGRKWVTVSGRVRIFDNSLGNLPNGVATENALFTKAAVRYFRPFTSDSIRMRASFVNPLSLQAGKTGLVVCADQTMTTGLVAQLETGLANNWLHLGILDGAPDRVVYQGQPVRNVVENNDVHTIGYSARTKTLTVWKGDDLTPMGSWADAAEMIPHGPGYRYMGLIFEASLASSGIQVTSIAATDDL